MVGDDGGDGEGAGWWNPRVAEVLLLQVPADAAGEKVLAAPNRFLLFAPILPHSVPFT